MSKKIKYDVSYSLLRVIACMAVVLHHVVTAVYGDLTKTELPLLLDNLLMCNNGLFFMLSGKLALEQYDGEILRYYKKKISSVLVPVFILSAFYYMYCNGKAVFEGGVFPGIVRFLRAFMANDIVEYFWFVFTLLGFYLVVPFFHAMFQRMTEAEKKLFLFLLLGIVFITNIGQIIGYDIRVEGYPFTSYIAFCFLGYLADNSFMCRHIKGFVVCGAVATVVSCYECIRQINPSIYGMCLTRMMMCIALFYLVTRYLACLTKVCQSPINFMAKYAFSIYLFHGFVQEKLLLWTNGIGNGKNSGVYCAICSILIFFLSLTLALFFESVLSFFRRVLYNGTRLRKR